MFDYGVTPPRKLTASI